MVLKKKHSKQLKKNRQKKIEKSQKKEPEIDFDTSAYVIYNRLEMTYPCLSFDIVPDDNASSAVDFKSLSLYLVAGAQTPPHVENNYVYVMKVDNIKPLKQEDEEEDESDDDEQDDSESTPNLTSVRVVHKGCVNRIRVNKIGGRTLASTWSDRGKVHIYDLTIPLQAVSDQKSLKTYVAQKVEPKPIFTFGGHLSEGYAVDWSPLKLGSLATGDCKKNVHIWTMKNQSEWIIDQQPLGGHENSVEDIKWSPEDENILVSCSTDKSIRFWDLRNKVLERCINQIKDAHKSDINVIDWNSKSKNFIMSGGDDGVVKVWDVRMVKTIDSLVFPLAHFDYHKKPITSVEWNPKDDTVMAVSSEDDKLTLWDLAVEKDDEEGGDNQDNMDVDNDDDKEEIEGIDYKIPEQMLFLHQGQTEIKELHWHPQIDGLIISTALDGMNIVKTISA